MRNAVIKWANIAFAILGLWTAFWLLTGTSQDHDPWKPCVWPFGVSSLLAGVGSGGVFLRHRGWLCIAVAGQTTFIAFVYWGMYRVTQLPNMSISLLGTVLLPLGGCIMLAALVSNYLWGHMYCIERPPGTVEPEPDSDLAD